MPSTAHRLLGTLVARGYAAQSPNSGRYLLGYKLLELTSGLQDRLHRLKTAARPHLEAIQAETGETTNLVVLEGRDVVYVDSVSGTRSVRLFTEIGRAIPAHTSGAGKALLAWRDPGEVEALLGGTALQPSTPRTLTTLDALQDDFTKIRRRGYSTDNEEHELGVACVATPVFDHTGLPAGGDQRVRPDAADPARGDGGHGRPAPRARGSRSRRSCSALTRPAGRRRRSRGRGGLRGSRPSPPPWRRSCRPCRCRRRCRA